MKKFKKKMKKFFKLAVFVFAVLKFFVDVADVVELFQKIVSIVTNYSVRGLFLNSPRSV